MSYVWEYVCDKYRWSFSEQYSLCKSKTWKKIISVAGSKRALIFLEMGYFCHCIFSLTSKEDENIALIPHTKYLLNVNLSEKWFKFSKKKSCLWKVKYWLFWIYKIYSNFDFLMNITLSNRFWIFHSNLPSSLVGPCRKS